MQYRRTYLRTIVCATATGLATGLAGCSGDEISSQNTPTTTAQTANTATTTTERTEGDLDQARSHYNDAIETLVENHETIIDWAEGRTAQRDDQAVQLLRDNVASARDSLDKAEAVAPEDFLAQVGHARDAATFQETIATYHAVVIDFEETVADAKAFADAEQNEEAIEQYEAARPLLDDARSRLDEVEAAHEQLDSDALDEPGLDYSGRYTHYVGVEAPGTIDARELSIDGQIHLNRAFVELEAGDQHYRAEEFTKARQRFEAGDEALRQSEGAFTAVQEHEYAYESLREGGIQVLGLIEDLQEAFDLFIDGAQEAEAGNIQEANELMADGFSVLQRAFEE